MIPPHSLRLLSFGRERLSFVCQVIVTVTGTETRSRVSTRNSKVDLTNGVANRTFLGISQTYLLPSIEALRYLGKDTTWEYQMISCFPLWTYFHLDLGLEDRDLFEGIRTVLPDSRSCDEQYIPRYLDSNARSRLHLQFPSSTLGKCKNYYSIATTAINTTTESPSCVDLVA